MHSLFMRNEDVISGRDDLEFLCTFKNFPVFMGCTDKPRSQDISADMHWHISRSSGCIQLNPCLPLDIAYMDAHASGTIGKTWSEHHKAFARFLAKFNPPKILEVGGGSGALSREYANLHPETEWVIAEPNPRPLEGVTARYIKTFVDGNFIPDQEYTVLVHSHTLEHMYSPRNFVEHVSSFMPPGSMQIFSIPDLESWFSRFYPSSLNFEHTYLLNDKYAEYIMSVFGWELVDKFLYKDRHSIFYAWRKTCSSGNIKNYFPKYYEINKNLFMKYCEYYRKIVYECNTKLHMTGKKVFLFGAHVNSQNLFNFGLDESRIISLLDNDPTKQGKRLYGTGLCTASPKVLADLEAPTVILNAGPYGQEIKTDILNNINRRTEFWE